MTSPSPGGTDGSYLTAVAAAAGRSAWAVGFTAVNSRTVIEHWNGRSWKRMTSKNPGTGRHGDGLFGVTAAARRAWAVGTFLNSTQDRTLIEAWHGKSWQTQG